MTTTHDRAPGSAANDPGEDVDSYLRHNLMLVQTGRRSRAPGVRRCADCDTPYIDDHSGLTWCRTCRVTRHRRCADCRTSMPITPDGDRLCDCCRAQGALFAMTADQTGNPS